MADEEPADLADERVALAGLEALTDSRVPPPTAVVGRSGQVYHSGSFLCLKPHWWLRRQAILLVESAWFEPFVGMVIVANVGLMAWDSPLDPPLTSKAELVAAANDFFRAFFTNEMVARMLAMGVICHRHSYLRCPWCVLDFTVVALAWLPTLFPDVGNFTALRTLRALRPLRALRFVPGMSTLVQSLLSSLPRLGTTAALSTLVVIVFGIVGEQLYQGVFHYRCTDSSGGPRRALKGGGGGGSQRAEGVVFCVPSEPSAACGEGGTCAYFEAHPEGQPVSFDSVGEASMAVVQIVTFDSWADTMYDLMAASSPYAWVYVLLVGLLGGFFVANLFTAVVFDEFMRENEAAKARATPLLEEGDGDGAAHAQPGAAEPSDDPRKPSTAPVEPNSNGYGRLHDEDGNPPTGGAAPNDGKVGCMRALVRSSPFGFLSLLLITGNTALMCMPYAGQPPEMASRLETASQYFTLAFTIELLVCATPMMATPMASTPMQTRRSVAYTRVNARPLPFGPVAHAHRRSTRPPLAVSTRSELGLCRCGCSVSVSPSSLRTHGTSSTPYWLAPRPSSSLRTSTRRLLRNRTPISRRFARCACCACYACCGCCG